MKEKIKNRFNIINNFPFIIMVAVAVIIVFLVNVYLKFRPHDTIYQTGYMVLANNMSYNLINNNSINDSLNVGVVSVNNGDSIYKQIDSFYVGEVEKKEIDYGYPIYSPDGLTIYAVNDEFTLIDRNFEMLDGYEGLSMNYGFVYNEGDEEPSDHVDYLFMKLENSIFINSQVINIQTEDNEYGIPVNSPIYFNGKYINYYAFDGKNFNYNRIDDIEYESIIRIGDVTVTYEELLLKMNVVKKIDLEDDKEKTEEEENQSGSGNNLGNGNGSGNNLGNGNGSGNNLGNGNGPGNGIAEGDKLGDDSGNGTDEGTGNIDDSVLDEILGKYVKPEVKIDSFDVKTYSISANITIDDPSLTITSSPMIYVYRASGKLYSRKRIKTSGQIKMVALSADTNYKIVGKYMYKDRFGVEQTKVFFEQEFKTKTLDDLEKIKISSEVGQRYSNKLEIKNFTVLNPEIETLNGVKKIVIQTFKETEEDSVENTNLSSSTIKKILKGEPVNIQTNSILNSNTVYNYKILFYDRDSNVFSLDGKSSGKIQTTKKAPYITKTKWQYDYDKNAITIRFATSNKDGVDIKDYKYKFYKANGEIIEEKELSFKHNEIIELKYENLVYDTEYYFEITGLYDLEDGNGEVKISKKIPSNVPIYIPYPTNFLSWFNNSTLKISDTSISGDIYVSKKANVLSKNNGFIKVYLEDIEGNPIKDSHGNDIVKTFINVESLTNGEEISEGLGIYAQKDVPSSYYIEQIEFDNLNSDTEYVIKLSVGLLNSESENGKDFESDKIIIGKVIKTNKQTPYVEYTKKVLYNDTFMFEYKIVDKDDVLGNSSVRIDIYEDDCNKNGNSCNSLYLLDNIYGEIINLTTKNKNGEIEGLIKLDNYLADEYTVAVSVVSKLIGNRQYVKMKAQNESIDNALNYSIVTRTVDLYAQMKNQVVDSNITKSTFEVVYQNGTTNNDMINNGMIFYDCDESEKFCNKISDIKYENNKTIVTSENDTSNLMNKNRKFLVVVGDGEKNNTVGISGDIVFSLEYETGKLIKEITNLDELLIINKNTHYVVTNNISVDWADSKIKKDYIISSMDETIDFQGHTLTLKHSHNESSEKKTGSFISTLGSNGVLKNVEVNFIVDYKSYDSVKDGGIVGSNSGRIEDIIINVEQKNSDFLLNLGFIRTNEKRGVINRFAIYLKTDYYITGNSALLNNYNYGIIKNGYYSTHPDKISLCNQYNVDSCIKTVYSDNSIYLVSNNNYNTIKNIYNLVNTKSFYANQKVGIGFVNGNQAGALTQNTLFLGKTTQTPGGNGPNVYSNSAIARNNYYIKNDTSTFDSVTYPANIEMSENLLTNTFFMDSLFNDENQFNISTWYYPSLKFSNLMMRKQKMISMNINNSYRNQIGLILAVSAEEDTRYKIEDPNLGPAEKTIKYQTSKINLYFNNPSSYVITKIIMEDGVTAKINSENTQIDAETGMTILDVDLTLDSDGIAKSSYIINSYTYCYRNCETMNPRTETIPVYKEISVDLFREVTDYDSFLYYINTDQNILITESFVIDKNLDERLDRINGVTPRTANSYVNLPNNNFKDPKTDQRYTAKIYGVLDKTTGKGPTIDFNEITITRGWFLPIVKGSLKNFQITRLSIKTSVFPQLGFIAQLSTGATIENVDISDSVFEYINNESNKTYWIGTLASRLAALTSVTKSSSNNNIIRLNSESSQNIKESYVGGLIGWASKTSITNSYVYNIKMENINSSSATGTLAAGGIIGYLTSGQITNGYATGNITSNYSSVGGIIGINDLSSLQNLYSYVNISSSGLNLGGIVGLQKMPAVNINHINNVMSIGGVEEGERVYSYFFSANATNRGELLKNAYMLNLEKESNQTIKENIKSIVNSELNLFDFEKFDVEDVFDTAYNIDNNGNKGLPYLKNTSFVEQKIAQTVYKDLNEKIEISISYNCPSEFNIDEKNGLCYNSKNQKILPSDNMAFIEFDSNHQIKITSEEENPEILINNCRNNETKTRTICEVKPYSAFKDIYKIEIDGNIQRLYIPFYRIVSNSTEWKKISTVENENIALAGNIKFQEADTDITNKKINNFIGGSFKVYYELDSTKINEETTCTNQANLTVAYKDCIKGNIEKYGNETRLKLNEPLIYSLNGVMENVVFENFEFGVASNNFKSCKFSTCDDGTGLIFINNGKITNSAKEDKTMFNNIKLYGNDNVGAIALNYGYINNIELKHVSASGQTSVGGLVGTSKVEDIDYRIENIKADSIYVEGIYQLGGIEGKGQYKSQNLSINNFYIKYSLKNNNSSTTFGRMAGVIGAGDCSPNCRASNGLLVVKGNYVGGVAAVRSVLWTMSKSESKNIKIQNLDGTSSSYVGGIVGQYDANNGYYVENFRLYDYNGNLNQFNGNYVGGAIGSMSTGALNCYIKDSYISGTSSVGGVAGRQGYAGNTQNNVVTNTSIVSNDSTTGGVGGVVGIVSGAYATSGTPAYSNNQIYKVNLSGKKRVGGIVGYFANKTESYQTIRVQNNLIVDLKIGKNASQEASYGMIVGYLDQIPAYTDNKIFSNNVYYNSSESYDASIESIGAVGDETTGLGGSGFPSGYRNFIEILEENKIIRVKSYSGIVDVFGDAKTQKIILENKYKLTTSNLGKINYVSTNDDKHYFPFLNMESWKIKKLIPIFDDKTYQDYTDKNIIEQTNYIVDPEDFVEIPKTINTGQSLMLATKNLTTANKNNYNGIKKEPLELDVYVVDVDKINIDFSDIDEKSTFTYKIGDYVSSEIPIINRTFTISYDFKESIQITLNSAGQIKNKTIKSNELTRTISHVDGKIYYISNGLLFNEEKAINGGFINLYNEKVLTSDGMIYNILTKEEISSNIDYSIQYDAKPLYSFEYNGGIVETYYNYSVYNSIIKNYQTILKNGVLNIIDNTIDNKKNSYIIDSYNNSEVQIVLKNDGILYSLKGTIKYPNDFDNKNIVDLYTNFNSDFTIAIIKYKNGEVYAFDYLKGIKLFSSVTNQSINLIDFIKDKIYNDVDNNIPSLVSMEKYEEMEILKEKLLDVSLVEANSKINGDNNSEPIGEVEYLTVYNDVTNNYDIYNIDNFLNSIKLETENEKINRDYELVQFYETLNIKKQERSLSGIIIFTLSIISILTSLYILVKTKKSRG